mgnify:CR=1 FL=1
MNLENFIVQNRSKTEHISMEILSKISIRDKRCTNDFKSYTVIGCPCTILNTNNNDSETSRDANASS